LEEGQTDKPINRLHLGVGPSQHADYDANQGEVSSRGRGKPLPQFMEALRADHGVRVSGLPRAEEGL
jgi:hypothetical protein